MIQDKRLDKVTKSLTPKQAVVLWLEEIRQYRNADEYVQVLKKSARKCGSHYQADRTDR